MSIAFAQILKRLRMEKGLSQNEMAERIGVSRPTVARWENGSRLPDTAMIIHISRCLNVDTESLLSVATKSDESPNVIMVDDRKVILTSGLPVLKAAMPHALVTGFTRPAKAIEYAKAHRVALAFLDIEMGKLSGLEVCRTLLEINPHTNVVYLTAYSDYALDAWGTGASGYMLKPLTPEGVQAQLKKLRYPFPL